VSGAWMASRLTATTEPAALVGGLALAGIAGIGVGVAPAFWVVLACNLVWGVGDAVSLVAMTGLLQRRTPDAVRGRVVAARESIVNVAVMVGFLAAGPTIAAIGAQPTYAVGGVAALAAAVLASTVLAAARSDASRMSATESRR
jgi:MFS family permease